VPFLQRYTFRAGISTWAPSSWITTTYFGTEAAGRGFTLAAEGYLNFGLLGAFAELALVGIFVRWLSKKYSTRPSAMWGVIFLGCFGVLILAIRNHLNIVTNVCAQIAVIGFLLNLFLGNEPSSGYQTDESNELDYGPYIEEHIGVQYND
jgi:lipid-A-disaccharide synthase-like uncharacterized protein